MSDDTMTAADTLALFAEAIWSPTDLLEIRCFPQKRKNGPAAPVSLWLLAETLHTKAENLEALNKAGLNVSVGVLPRREEGDKSDDDTLPGWVLWADLDDIEPKEAWSRITSAGLPKPSAVVNSGHGIHAYFRLKSPVEPANLSEAVGDLAVLLESDPSVKNPSRIMRLPGFRNLKDPVASVELLHAEPEVQYEWDEIRALIPRREAKNAHHVVPQDRGKSRHQCGDRGEVIERARRYIATIPGENPGGRTTRAFRVAAALRNDFGLSEGEALPLLVGWDSAANTPSIASDPKYGHDELASILKNAAKHAKRAPGRLADSDRSTHRSGTSSTRIALPTALQRGSAELREIFRAEGRGDLKTIPLPWKRLSSLSAMLRPGVFSVVGAPPGHAKSLFVLQIVVNAFLEYGVPFALLPLEGSKAEFMRRVLAYLAGTWSVIDDNQEDACERELVLDRYKTKLDAVAQHVSENPCLPIAARDGNQTVPDVTRHDVIKWVVESVKGTGARIVAIDPMAMISFSYPDWRDQEAFIKELNHTTWKLGISTILVAHLKKRPGVAASIRMTGEDLQGSSALRRFPQVVVLLDHHEEKSSEVWKPGGLRETVFHDRTVFLDKSRGTSGRGAALAYRIEKESPYFIELGVIAPRSTSATKHAAPIRKETKPSPKQERIL